jgi:hypothetical protein
MDLDQQEIYHLQVMVQITLAVAEVETTLDHQV